MTVRSAHFIVNCFKKIVMATINNIGLNSNYLLVSEEQQERERGERHRVRINRRLQRGFKWKIYAASATCSLIAEADRVLSHLVMFLPVFLHWIYKMKYSSYQHSFVILGWLVYWVVVEKCAARQKEIGNHRFQK